MRFRIALKELRETKRWLKLIKHIPLVKQTANIGATLAETEELIKIFVSSIHTAEKKKK